jgi:two-component sensor histidine kinase
MDSTPLGLPAELDEAQRVHLSNVAANLQLVADLGYGDVALAAREADGTLHVVADARPMTAVAAIAFSRVGRALSAHDEQEAYRAVAEGAAISGERRRTTRGIQYLTSAHPIGDPVVGVLVRDVSQQVAHAPGMMERQFMALAEDLIEVIRRAPLIDARRGGPFATTRRAGDGVMRVDENGRIAYASPNGVTIMRLAGVDGALAGTEALRLPGATTALAPVLGGRGALESEVSVAGRVLLYRVISLEKGAAVLVEDTTEARQREAEIKVKEATIREVHHRVKNNLQTISSLLRIQARRSGSAEASRALAEAVERVGSMAVVHEMLSASTEETVDFVEAARTVVDMVRQGLAGQSASTSVTVEGSTGEVPAAVATSLALVIAELVHNAIEHGLSPKGSGHVTVSARRVPDELRLTVRDDGVGLPEGFELTGSSHLGLEIVRTLVEDDLRGTLALRGGAGTTVVITIPIYG